MLLLLLLLRVLQDKRRQFLGTQSHLEERSESRPFGGRSRNIP